MSFPMAVQTDIVHYVWTNWARGRDGKGSNEPLCAGKRRQGVALSLPDVKTHDAWTQGVKCSHPEADAAASAKSYLEIKKRFESVRWRSGGILYPSCASGQVAAQEASGRFFDPP